MYQRWNLETWSRSRDLVLRVSVVSGLVSVSKVSGLEILNNANKCFIKISIIQRCLVCCICWNETTKTRRKNARNVKKIQVRSDDDI